MKVLIAMMRRLDDYAWEALRCTSAEDVVDKFLLEDLHPPMQSCIHMADDSEEFWCSTRATHVENEERAEAEWGREREQKEAAQAALKSSEDLLETKVEDAKLLKTQAMKSFNSSKATLMDQHENNMKNLRDGRDKTLKSIEEEKQLLQLVRCCGGVARHLCER